MRIQFVGSLLVAILFTISARADVTADLLTVNFTSASLSGSAGETLTFRGTLVNNSGSTVYINGDSFNLAGFPPAAYDADLFLANAPQTPLADGESTGSFDFFTVTIPLGFAAGSYGGTIVVQGGDTVDDDALLGSGSFTVVVEGTGVPEPDSWLLLGTMLVGSGVVHRLRRRRTDM